MGREILFRGKRKDNGRWVEGYYQQRYDAFENIQHLIFWAKSYTVWEYVEVDPGSICQYTGLTDKHGRKIFEGDIVKGVAYSIDFIGYIVWIDTIAGFGVRYFNKHREPTAWENSSILKAIQRWKQPNEFQAEVIGNIFDNPELLNQ